MPAASSASFISDPLFHDPYIDADEWHDKPVRHRYVHGGFKGTEARFSFYFPPKGQYQGRFFQYIDPVPSNENLAQQSDNENDTIAFSIASGGYFVESNEGGLSAIAGDQTIPGYRVSAASAEYSRLVAAQMYGPHRPYGYAWGGSGGGFKTISGFENTHTWDGAVPFVIGSPLALPNVFTARLLALRVLYDKFPSILDAVEPGGSGDMYQGLNQEQKDVLREVTEMGFPPQGWFNYKTLGEGGFAVLFGLIRAMDHVYFEDFWKVAGYTGANPPESLVRARIQYKTVVKKVISASEARANPAMGGVNTAWLQLKGDAPVGFELENVPSGNLQGAFLMLKTGAAAGKDLPIGKVSGKTVFVEINPFGKNDSEAVSAIKAGDELQVDNSDFLAVQYYHRHQVPTPDFYPWDQFRGPDGKPLYPQRPMLIGPMITGAGSVQSGQFQGKMIVVENMTDQDAFPWQADWYRTKVRQHGDQNFRLWFTEHAVHGDPEKGVGETHVVSYRGILQQALLDVSAWVEKDIPPPPSTAYRVVDAQIVVPATAAERCGIQPLVRVTANGAQRAEAAPGQPVKFSAAVELPPHTGQIVAAEWDFDGEGNFPTKQEIPNASISDSGSRMILTITHSFPKPGTYFPALRATSQRDGDAHTPFGRIANLGRVRVVVQ